MEIVLKPFDIKDGEEYYYINETGEIFCAYYEADELYDTCQLENGKACKNKNLMEQKALHQNLNDLLWKFTIENGWSDELWKDFRKKKYYIDFDLEAEKFDIDFSIRYKTQGTIYFVSKGIAQSAIDEIVKPYMEEHPEFVW